MVCGRSCFTLLYFKPPHWPTVTRKMWLWPFVTNGENFFFSCRHGGTGFHLPRLLVLLSFHWLFFATYVTSSIIRCLCPFIIFHLLSCMPLPSRKPVTREDRKRIKYWLPSIQQYIRTEERERDRRKYRYNNYWQMHTHTHKTYASARTHREKERKKGQKESKLSTPLV